jgi:ATP-dependent RNA helicase HelY
MTAEVAQALDRLKPGDVLLGPGGGADGRIAVLSTARRKGGDLRLRAVTRDGEVLTLLARDFQAPPLPVARIELPVPYAPGRPGFQRQVAAALVRLRVRGGGRAPVVEARSRHRRPDDSAAAGHPVAGCPDLGGHLRAGERADRLAREAERLERRIRGRSESLARQFDRVLRVLEAWGYVDGWSLTAPGQRLATLYHEADLLVAECLERGLFDGLDGPSVAALASTFTYEARGPGEGRTPSWPTKRVRERWAEAEALASDLNAAEEEAGLPLTRRPDAGFASLAYEWAEGHDLEDVIGGDEVSGGDFVRNVKQLIDLLRQIGDVAPAAATRGAARNAAERLFRGVISASSVVGAVEDSAAPAASPATAER